MMFNNLFGNKGRDVRDDAIQELLGLMVVHATNVMKDKDMGKDAIAVAAVPIIKLGDLVSLQEYLKKSQIPEVQEIGKVLMGISQDFKDAAKNKQKGNNGR